MVLTFTGKVLFVLKNVAHLTVTNVLMRSIRRRRLKLDGLIGKDASFENGIHLIIELLLFIP